MDEFLRWPLFGKVQRVNLTCDITSFRLRWFEPRPTSIQILPEANAVTWHVFYKITTLTNQFLSNFSENKSEIWDSKGDGTLSDLALYAQDLVICHSSWSVPMPARGPSLYYVSIFLAFLDPTHPPYQHKYSTERQQKLSFSRPTHPVLLLT